MTEACLLQRTNSRIFTKSYTSAATTENWLNAGSPAMLSTNQWEASGNSSDPSGMSSFLFSRDNEPCCIAVLLYDLYLQLHGIGIGLFLSTLSHPC